MDLSKIFKRGLITLAPLAITIAIVIWLFNVLEKVFRVPLIEIIGKKYYFPGIGILFAFIIIFLVGIVINNWLIRKFYDWGEKIIEHIPFVKSLYGAIHDVLNYLQVKEKDVANKVVRVEINGFYMLGFITRDDFADLPEGIGFQDEVVVYLPMSYQIGGYTILVHKDKINPVDISVESGMRLIITAAAQSSLKNGIKKNKSAPK
jgi:uncharacterized membrane protein